MLLEIVGELEGVVMQLAIQLAILQVLFILHVTLPLLIVLQVMPGDVLIVHFQLALREQLIGTYIAMIVQIPALTISI